MPHACRRGRAHGQMGYFLRTNKEEENVMCFSCLFAPILAILSAILGLFGGAPLI